MHHRIEREQDNSLCFEAGANFRRLEQEETGRIVLLDLVSHDLALRLALVYHSHGVLSI